MWHSKAARLVARRCERLDLTTPLLAKSAEAVYQQQCRRITLRPCADARQEVGTAGHSTVA